LKIFISHSHADKEFVAKIHRELVDASADEITLWHSGNLPLGMNWKDEVEYRIANADSYIALLSNNYMSSSFATYELGRLLQIQKSNKKLVFPIIIHPLNISDTPVSDIKGFEVFDEIDLVEILPKIIKATDKSTSNKLPIDCGEVYLKYERLELDVLSGLMYSIKNIYYLLYGCESRGSISFNKNNIRRQDRIILYESNTGESIKFKVKTGWMPRVEVDGEDIIVESPKAVITLLASFYLLSMAVENTTSSYRDILEIIKTDNDIEMQSLQKEKTMLEIEKIKKELRNISPKAHDNIERELHHFLRHTVHNNDVKSIRLKTRFKETEQIY